MKNVATKHPQYTYQLPDWEQMRDAYEGERRVKSKTVKYLHATTAMILDGFGGPAANSIGAKNYAAYMMRARFPNFVREAVQMAIGMMHSQPAVIKLPKGMEGITGVRGESLTQLLREVNSEQLITGRVGLMADIATVTDGTNDMPRISVYKTESIINWDDGESDESIPQKLEMVVLDESQHRREGFEWTEIEKHRVLMTHAGLYMQAVCEEQDFDESQLKAPHYKGRELNKIPFVIINSCDVSTEVDTPPLLDLGNACMAIYRGEADYRQNLHYQGQDTFVTVGGSFDEGEEVRVGTGARIDLPLGGKAEYVGVNGEGLEEQRVSLERLESRAGSMGAQTLDSTSRERESGDSLRIRVAARTADMNQIVEAGAEGLQSLLKTIAEWIGENPDEVSVTPNKEFGEMPLTGQTMVEMATARNLGFPISAKSLHNIARKRRITQMTYEEEITEAQKEAEDDFVFKKAESGDRSADQPNSHEDGKQISGLEGSDKKKPKDE